MAKVKLLSESALEKKYINSSRAKIRIPDSHVLCLPSRILPLNWQLGGGLFYGRIFELFGYESTGKSLLAMDFVYAAQKLGGVALWADAEGTWNNSWAEQNGVNTEELILYDSNEIEGISDWCLDYIRYYRSKLVKNEPILLVIDSVATLNTAISTDALQSDEKADMGKRAKAMSNLLRLRSQFFKRMGVCVIFINQVRKKIGATMFEQAETTPGGDALRFYCTARLGLNAGKQIKGLMRKGKFEESIQKGHKCGRNVYMQIHKNKMGPPKDSVKTQVYFTDEPSGYVGYSRYHGLETILIEKGIVRKKGNSITYKGKTIARGSDHLLKILIENEKLRRILVKRAGINTISTFREKLDSLDKNLYALKVKSDEDEKE